MEMPRFGIELHPNSAVSGQIDMQRAYALLVCVVGVLNSVYVAILVSVLKRCLLTSAES